MYKCDLILEFPKSVHLQELTGLLFKCVFERIEDGLLEHDSFFFDRETIQVDDQEKLVCVSARFLLPGWTVDADVGDNDT